MANPLVPHSTHQVIDSTKLQAYLTCPRMYFWEYVLGWRREVPSNHLHFGSAWHEAMETLLRHGYGDDAVIMAYQAFEKKYREMYDSETDEIYAPKNPERALLALAKYVQRYSDDQYKYEVLHTEVAGTVAISESRLLRFKMDSIVRDKQDGSILSIEHKTGSSTWGWDTQWPLSLQCGTYNHALNCMYEMDNVKGILISGTFFKKVKKISPDCIDFMRIPVFNQPWQMNRWLWLVNIYYEQIEREMEMAFSASDDEPNFDAFPLNPTNCSKFFGCPYHDFCCAWENPLQHCHTPPIGFTEYRWDPSAEASPKATIVALEMKDG